MLSRAVGSCCYPFTSSKTFQNLLTKPAGIAGGQNSEQQRSYRCSSTFEGAGSRLGRLGHISSVRPNVCHAAASGCRACAVGHGMHLRQTGTKTAQWPPVGQPTGRAACLPAQAGRLGPPDAEQPLPDAGATAQAGESGSPQQRGRSEQRQPSKLRQQRHVQEAASPRRQAERTPQASAAQRLQRQQRSRQQLVPGQALPTAPQSRQLRQQLKQLQQLQSQQQRAPHDPKSFRAAAAGSTALLLSLVQSDLPQLLAPSAPAAAAGAPPQAAAAAAAAAAGGKDTPDEATAPSAACDSERRAKQRWLAALADALVTVSWHCKTHELLPTEAARLQELLLQQLLPALGPHVRQAQRSALARVVFALGSCHASAWPQHSNSSNMGFDDGTRSAGAASNDGPAGAGASADGSTTGSMVAQEQGQPAKQQCSEPGTCSADNNQGSPAAGAAERPLLRDKQQQQQPRSWAGLSSEQWVQALLPLLPPERLSPGALLAAWQGCALLGLLPPAAWLQSACLAAYSALQQRRLDHTDTAALLQSCAALQFSPPTWLMHELVAAVLQQLPMFTPADLAGVMSALQELSFRPSNTFLRVWCECSSRLLRGMTVSQLAAVAGGLSWAGHSPPAWWVRRLVAASQLLLPVADEDELLLLLHAVLGMRPQPPLGWLHETFCHLRSSRAHLSLRQVADAAHVLAGLQLPDSFRVHHRHWLASCLRRLGNRWQQLAAEESSSSSMSRSELLYTLYAAGKLQVAPGGAWLAIALRRLHQSLPGASPAELVASFVVFCHFWRSRQQQKQKKRQLQQQQEGEPTPAETSGSGFSSSPGNSSNWVGLQECLAAAAACVDEFSDEGLLQLLLACADVGLQATNSSQCSSTTADAEAVDAAAEQHQQSKTPQHVMLLADTLSARMERLPLLQLSRLVKALEGRATSHAAASGGGLGAARPAWFQQLLQHGKATLAAKA